MYQMPTIQKIYGQIIDTTMTLDTKQLRYFYEIAQQGSVTRASQVLNVAQPALSLHLRRLEERLGTSLMLRTRTGVVPTEAGRLLMERARHILDEIARTQEDIRSLDGAPSGVVRLGLPGTISALVSLPLIKAARQRYPQITINIAEAMSGFISGWLREGKSDLAILYHPLQERGFRSDILLEEELVILWSQAFRMPPKAALSRLQGVPLVLPSRGNGLRDLIEEAFRAQGVSATVGIEIDSYANIKSLVAEGFGASILPAHAVQAETRTGAICTSRIANPGLWRRAHVIQPTARPATRAQTAIAQLLPQVVADLVAKGAWSGARAIAGGAMGAP